MGLPMSQEIWQWGSASNEYITSPPCCQNPKAPSGGLELNHDPPPGHPDWGWALPPSLFGDQVRLDHSPSSCTVCLGQPVPLSPSLTDPSHAMPLLLPPGQVGAGLHPVGSGCDPAPMELDRGWAMPPLAPTGLSHVPLHDWIRARLPPTPSLAEPALGAKLSLLAGSSPWKDWALLIQPTRQKG